MKNVKLEFAQRLREAMQAMGYEPKPSVLEREFNQRYWGKGVTLHGVRRWLLGETLPSQDKLLVLAEWLQVTPQQLRFGTDPSQQVEERHDRWERELSYGERETLDAFLRLPAPQRKVVREVILTFAQVYDRRADDEPSPPEPPAT
ncbi:hypothetical protein [Chitinimonas lacunae]|uniref:HTH cro/C1-type domain-containing protein n=1 Tax=Chitinimonas lacunae TaxID=1963018 RepID=A0ABV8MQL5_9NEIS